MIGKRARNNKGLPMYDYDMEKTNMLACRSEAGRGKEGIFSMYLVRFMYYSPTHLVLARASPCVHGFVRESQNKFFSSTV